MHERRGMPIDERRESELHRSSSVPGSRQSHAIHHGYPANGGPGAHLGTMANRIWISRSRRNTRESLSGPGSFNGGGNAQPGDLSSMEGMEKKYFFFKAPCPSSVEAESSGHRRGLLSPLPYPSCILTRRQNTPVSVWLYEQLSIRIEGKIRVSTSCHTTPHHTSPVPAR